MPSAKKLIGKTCVYCGRRPATTWDHVFARSFFPKHDGFRANLPQVPSCRECNNSKSEWETRLINLLQFAGDSLASKAVLVSGTVEHNLKKNKALAEEMTRGFFARDKKSSGGIYYRESGFQLSNESVGHISRWNLSVAKAFYYFWTGRVVESSWERFVVNPAIPGLHEFLVQSINATAESYSLQNKDCGWRVTGAQSNDGIVLFGIEFNSIVQYVFFLKNRYMPVAEQLREMSYK